MSEKPYMHPDYLEEIGRHYPTAHALIVWQEAEIDRLRAALQEIADRAANDRGAIWCRERAIAALQGSDTPGYLMDVMVETEDDRIKRYRRDHALWALAGMMQWCLEHGEQDQLEALTNLELVLYDLMRENAELHAALQGSTKGA